MPDLTEMSAAELDEFAAWAHAVEGTEHVTDVDLFATMLGRDHDQDARHGANTEDETAV